MHFFNLSVFDNSFTPQDLESIIFAVSQKKFTFYIAVLLRRRDLFLSRLEAIKAETPDDHPDAEPLAAVIAALQ